MTASTNGPRYAPADPTLPKPWRALVDGATGYIYFWNPDTNVTQYERPTSADPLPPSIPSSAVVKPTNNTNSKRDGDDDDRSRYYAGGKSSTSSRVSAEAYRRQHEITVSGDNVPAPFLTFQSTGFPSEILREVQNAGFSAPTPIQAQAWPVALSSRDIVAIAKTGSGKTLGYLIPGFIHLKRVRNNSKMGPTVLVLSPTRELATQIQNEAEKFGRSSRISCVCLYGGAPKGPQLRDLDKGADVVVATPGRLNDILEMRRVSLRQISYLVLDEADRMLDMGFEPQIRKIVKEIPPRRQTLMFTATWPKEVRKIAADLLVNPVQVNIGNINELVANKSITQYIELITYSEKSRRLEQILRSQEPGSKIIIFCSTKKMCDQLARNLTRQFGAAAIHGDKSQSERDHVLSQFRNGRSPVLVATDVAARGLDIKDIRVVINYDFPTGVEDYVHRIGRTGRAGATGLAYTFFGDQDAKHALDLVKVLEGADQRVPRELRDMAARGGYGGKSRRWGSGGHDGGQSYGGGSEGQSYGGDRGYSSYGGRGGRGDPTYSGRSEGGWGDSGPSPPHDRYDNENRDRHGMVSHCYQDSVTASDYKKGGEGRSRSCSPNKGGYGGGDKSRSRSRSRSRSVGFNSSSIAADPCEQSPPSKREEPSHSNHSSPVRNNYQGVQQQTDVCQPDCQHITTHVKGINEQFKYDDDDERDEKVASPSAQQQQWGSSPLKQGDAGGGPINGLSGSKERPEEEGMMPADEVVAADGDLAQ